MDPTADGSVAAGQSALPPSEDMGDGHPPAAAATRLLRIKKKPKPGLLAPAGATEATADSDARPPGATTLRKHVWQNVGIVREDLANSFRTRSTEEDVDAVRYSQPTDRSETPAEGSTQRGSTQRGSIPKFTQTGAPRVHLSAFPWFDG